MHGKHHLIDRTISLENFPEVLQMRLEVRRLLPAAKDTISAVDRFRAGDANEGDGAFASRR